MYINTIIFIFSLYIIYLFFESYQNKKYRKKIKHIIHVNGTRGKSSTSRLIEASLRGGQYKVFCKTTGTSPRIIDTNGVENPIIRKGRANIKEQLKIIKEAAMQGADLLVIECMAVNPELQYISQHKILNADISVVTNVRRDHLEEMGPSLKDVAIALGNVMPYNGVFITPEDYFIDYYRQVGKKQNSKVILAEDIDGDYGIDFKENVSIALEVCRVLGVDKDTALQRMKNYKKDPGVLKIYQIYNDRNIDIKFVNGLAINDPDSISIIYNRLKKIGLFNNKDLIILVNNRADRPDRMKQHLDLIRQLDFNQIWITGEFKNAMKRKLVRYGIDSNLIKAIGNLDFKILNDIQNDSIIYAIGNIVGHGQDLINYIEDIGDAIV
ncbi:MAG: poly-gamma-glutamate synthase PgsB [Tissierellia bacterium]|nr:poly-gamma-glutamate synthase PgsB [Tissierellia bacterium]MDD4725944.1 poly-gamma-glutamate synthase PgsB [Tissierellia bacterium]